MEMEASNSKIYNPQPHKAKNLTDPPTPAAVGPSSLPAAVIVDDKLDVQDASRDFDAHKDLDDRFVWDSEESVKIPQDASKKDEEEDSSGEGSASEEEEEEEELDDEEEDVTPRKRVDAVLDDKEEESGDARDDDRIKEDPIKNKLDEEEDTSVDDQTGSSSKEDVEAEEPVDDETDSEETGKIEPKGKPNLVLIEESEEDAKSGTPVIIEGSKSKTETSSEGDDDEEQNESTKNEVHQKVVYNHDASSLVGKEIVISLLDKAGVTISELDPVTVKQLPTWETIQNMYYASSDNAEPIVHGLDTCASYRKTVAVDDQFLAIAGLFNTGTNALDWTLSHNIEGRQTRWQVPWGKHRLEKVKWNHTVDDDMDLYNKTNVLPVVIIKDPFTWLQSMCSSPYATKWRHTKAHCPNLVPNEHDREKFPLLAQRESIPVKIKFDETSTEYWDSLVHIWNDWYLQYYNADYPLLMVRFEDLLFSPERLLNQIASCIGTTVRNPVKFKVKSSKSHGSHTDLVHAFIKFGNAEVERVANMTVDDLRFADRTLDATLMNVFHYRKSSPRPGVGLDGSMSALQ